MLERIVIVVVIAAMAFTVAACENVRPSVAVPEPILVPLPIIDPATWAARGTVLSDEALDVEPLIAEQAGQVRHVVYRSVSGLTGAPTDVSGSFYIPRQPPRPGGYPVLGLAHGFTGITRDCAPSSRPDLREYYGLVAALLKSGFAVAMTDYEGLGGPGIHPFLESRTAGFNVIDSVRVLRGLVPDTSQRWLAFGISQGGQASWAANELNDFYGIDGMQLVGATAIAPAVNVAAQAELAFREELTEPQRQGMPSLVVGAEQSFPPVPVNRLLRGAAVEDVETIVGCSDRSAGLRNAITARDVKPDTEADVAALSTALRKMALPTRPLNAPLFVLSGGRDDVVLPNWVTTTVARACLLGGKIVHEEIANQDHTIQPSDRLGQWVSDRFADKPAPSDCPG